MARAFRQTAKLLRLASAALALTLPGLTSAQSQTQGEMLCSLSPISYAGAKQNYPESAFAITELEQHSIATWYSDRNGDYVATAKQLVTTCPASSRLSVVVYGLPNKDCEARSSAAGSTVTNPEDYKRFIKSLVEIVGDRKALYVLEPDAVGLLAKEGGCGAQAGYKENLLLAIELLSANPNAEIYLDVGYWTLAYPESTARVAQVVKGLAAMGRVKGITLNTSNFRNSAEMSELCTNFQVSIGTNALNCIVDTSRNYNGSPSTEWCNLRPAGIGPPPNSITGYSNLGYFMWIKPPGESDGQCDTGRHTADAMAGPEPGAFFNEGFKLLWNQGYFVKELGLPMITDGVIIPVPSTRTPAPLPVTQIEVTSSPEPNAEISTSSLSPTMAPEELVLDAAIPSASSTPAEVVDNNVAAIPTTPVALPVETTPCPPSGSVSDAAMPVTPFPSRPSRSSLTPADAVLLKSVQQRPTAASLNEKPLSAETQQQMDEIAFNMEMLLRSNNGGLNSDVDGYDDVVDVLPTSGQYPVVEVPESVFLNENRLDALSITGSAISSSSSGSSFHMDDVDKVTLVLGPRESSVSTLASQTGSGSNSVNTLSAEKLVPSTETAPESAKVSTSSGGKGGTNRTEVLASLAVLGCVGALAVAMAVVSHRRKREALMEARLSTPETTIIHITPSDIAIA